MIAFVFPAGFPVPRHGRDLADKPPGRYSRLTCPRFDQPPSAIIAPNELNTTTRSPPF
jgi:hypothetical protein